jgi:hypothetical protein
MLDRRSHPRYGVKIEGRLMSPDLSFHVDVVIRNLSLDGALIQALAPASAVPERVYLWQARTKTLFECEVQWRKNNRLIGLRFTRECNRLSIRALLDAAVPAHMALNESAHAGPVALRCAG